MLLSHEQYNMFFNVPFGRRELSHEDEDQNLSMDHRGGNDNKPYIFDYCIFQNESACL
jgi:hypothetical protein